MSENGLPSRFSGWRLYVFEFVSFVDADTAQAPHAEALSLSRKNVPPALSGMINGAQAPFRGVPGGSGLKKQSPPRPQQG